jgi:hypothetical protein
MLSSAEKGPLKYIKQEGSSCISAWITGLRRITVKKKRCRKRELRLVCQSDIMKAVVIARRRKATIANLAKRDE